jgi:hypothetical protein
MSANGGTFAAAAQTTAGQLASDKRSFFERSAQTQRKSAIVSPFYLLSAQQRMLNTGQIRQ